MPSQDTINPVGLREELPAGRTPPLRLGLDGRPGARRSRRVPDLHWNDDPGLGGRRQDDPRASATTGSVVDNLMDLTHETFVHGGSIGNRAVAEAPFDVTHSDDTATVTRWMIDIDPPPFWAAAARQAGQGRPLADHQFRGALHDRDRRRGGAGRHRRAGGRPLAGRQRLRAEHDHAGDRQTCHYFWAFVRNYRLGEQRSTTELRDGVHGIFAEDEMILEAQQRAIDANPGRVFYNLNIDAGAMWARRLIDAHGRRRTADGAAARRRDEPPQRRPRRRCSRCGS